MMRLLFGLARSCCKKLNWRAGPRIYRDKAGGDISSFSTNLLPQVIAEKVVF
jgi:hypothetical protein